MASSSLRTASGVEAARVRCPGRDSWEPKELRIWWLFTFGASAACWTFMPNSTTFRKNCSRFWSWVSAPWTAKARCGWPSFIESVGVSVTRGRLPGASTL